MGVAVARAIRKDVPWRLAFSAAALLWLFTRRTAGTRPRPWVKFGTCARAPRAWLLARRVAKQARIASVFTGTACISVASRSAAPLTRLETRTKESNMCASHWVD